MKANPLDLLQDYNVLRPNGESPDSTAVYLVLRLDDFGENDAHVLACRAAARAYAKFVREHPPKLSEVGEALEKLLNELDGVICRR